jgi:hypothetical protein
LFALIDDERLKFNGEDFEVDGTDQTVSAYEIDDFLGHFEDLGTLEVTSQ